MAFKRSWVRLPSAPPKFNNLGAIETLCSQIVGVLPDASARSDCSFSVASRLWMRRTSALRVVHRMAKKAPDRVPAGPQLHRLTAQKVFGWRNVHKHDNALIGEEQDRTDAGAQPRCRATLRTLVTRRNRRTHEAAAWTIRGLSKNSPGSRELRRFPPTVIPRFSQAPCDNRRRPTNRKRRYVRGQENYWRSCERQLDAFWGNT
jgi:hypothetical protein